MKYVPQTLTLRTANNGFIVMPEQTEYGKASSTVTEDMHVFNNRIELGKFIEEWANQNNAQLRATEEEEKKDVKN